MTYIEVAELDNEGFRKSIESFNNVVTSSQYEESDGKDGYKERVVIEYESDDGKHILTETIESQYGARIIHVEEE